MLTREAIEGLAPTGQGRVHADAYSDTEVFHRELDAVFHTQWIYLAHESEIERPGDFKATHLGAAPVLLTRDEAGALFAALNICPNCGATLAQAAEGNTSAFHCIVDDLFFDSRGQVPGYDLRLMPLPRLDQYRGFIFGRLSSTGPSLLEHLGGARRAIDAWTDVASGRVHSAGSFKLACNANWKFVTEGIADAYQDSAGCVSFEGSQAPPDDSHPAPRVFALGNGHSLIEPTAGFDSAWEEHYQVEYVELLLSRFGRERTAALLGSNGWRLFLFPNTVLSEGGIRVARPIAIDRTEIVDTHFILDDTPDDYQERRLRAFEREYGPAGTRASDLELFERQQAALLAAESPGTEAWSLFTRGISEETRLSSGEIEAPLDSELPQRHFYEAWSHALLSEIATDAPVALQIEAALPQINRQTDEGTA